MPYPPIEDDPRLTAFALGEIDEAAEQAEVEARLAEDPEAAAFVEDVRRMARLLTDEFQKEHQAPPSLDPARREAVERELAGSPQRRASTFPFAMPRIRSYALAAAALVAVGGVSVVLMQRAEKNRSALDVASRHDYEPAPAPAPAPEAMPAPAPTATLALAPPPPMAAPATAPADARSTDRYSVSDFSPAAAAGGRGAMPSSKSAAPARLGRRLSAGEAEGLVAAQVQTGKPVSPPTDPKFFAMKARSYGSNPAGPGAPPPAGADLSRSNTRDKDQTAANQPEVAGLLVKEAKEKLGDLAELKQNFDDQLGQGVDREAFAAIVENPFVRVADQPLSTFGVDVDTASYANVRRFLIGENRLPPPDAVRIEEMVNYFRYNYAPPQDDRPFSVNVEFARCPWQAEHRLLRVGLKGREVSIANRPPSNLVFLIDVSGSMREYNKLPWVKESLRMLVEKLGENDRVAIVVYAGTKGLALPSTTGDRKDLILAAIDHLEGGGSTNGGEGLKLAYDLAQKDFVAGGINRIILCTDGDFNTGDVTDVAAVTRLAEEKRATKVKLTVLGFGQGNLQDDLLEALANKGDGQYAYIDTLKEAQRVLVEQMSGTLLTIAKDVKLQLDFNPRFVGAYRLLGYENRVLQAQDFRDDTKDAGEIGAGHTVTALYELVPPGKEAAVPGADPSRFQEPAKPKDDDLSKSAALVVNLRYKQPDGDVSTGFDLTATDPGGDYADASTDFKFAASVAEFGLLLRRSKFVGQATYEAVLELAQASQGDDPGGDRKEFLDLVRRARDLSKRGQ